MKAALNTEGWACFNCKANVNPEEHIIRLVDFKRGVTGRYLLSKDPSLFKGPLPLL